MAQHTWPTHSQWWFLLLPGAGGERLHIGKWMLPHTTDLLMGKRKLWEGKFPIPHLVAAEHLLLSGRKIYLKEVMLFWEDCNPQTLRKTKQTQNDYLSEWIPWRSSYLDIILKSEAPCQPPWNCFGCANTMETIHCVACLGNHIWCSVCAVKAHRTLPFHRIQQWNGRFYDIVTLQHLGYILYLGHQGDPCPLEGTSGMSSQHFTVVDSGGIFIHTVKWCQCDGATKEDKHLQLLQEQLFPATITNPQTAFTFGVLDEFIITSLECKTSAASFYKKLRRMTNNAFPDSLPDCYRELMKVARAWQDLTNCKRAGFGHDSDRVPGHGDLAIFCAACPQPGINLPDHWQNKYDSNTVAVRYVVDGNFTVQYMKMKRPMNDVSLSDGLAYMVEDEPYQLHVASAAENTEVSACIQKRSTCQNHRAVNDANIAWHGCFVPHSIVDFYRGEQQKNVDYSICQALTYHFAGLQKALVVYNVACQWYINFHRCLESYESLSLPSDLDIVPAVGKFHLSTHKPACFPRFSLMFIPGAGHLDGEILETIWVSFNTISPSARAMSLAHRQEVYDNHMRDSNWKKLTATAGLEGTEAPHKELTASLDKNKVLKAEQEKEKALDIRLHLVQSSVQRSEIQESVNWLVEGIEIEDAQDALRAEIRCLPSSPSNYQKTAITIKQQRLLGKIMKFNHKSSLFLAGLDLDNPLFCKEENSEAIDEDIEILFWQGPQVDEEEEEHLEDDVVDANPENIQLFGQANVCLEKLRNDLGEKSILYRINRRSSTSNRTDTRSKQDIHRDVRSYHRAVAALTSLEATNNVLGKYRTITHEELGLSKDITEENRYGQSSHVLPWFWRIEEADYRSSDWNDECEWDLLGRPFPAYRLIPHSLLKSRARYERWREELEMVKHKMMWTTLWFKNQGKEWERREMEAKLPGHKAYAAKQQHLWTSFKRIAEENFDKFIVL
ncbi:hypothetical protein V8E55_005314 [Tylopilus felleus]